MVLLATCGNKTPESVFNYYNAASWNASLPCYREKAWSFLNIVLFCSHCTFSGDWINSPSPYIGAIQTLCSSQPAFNNARKFADGCWQQARLCPHSAPVRKQKTSGDISANWIISWKKKIAWLLTTPPYMVTKQGDLPSDPGPPNVPWNMARGNQKSLQQGKKAAAMTSGDTSQHLWKRNISLPVQCHEFLYTQLHFKLSPCSQLWTQLFPCQWLNIFAILQYKGLYRDKCRMNSPQILPWTYVCMYEVSSHQGH